MSVTFGLLVRDSAQKSIHAFTGCKNIRLPMVKLDYGFSLSKILWFLLELMTAEQDARGLPEASFRSFPKEILMKPNRLHWSWLGVNMQ